ncbi:MAG: phospholipase [Gemmatimonadaceae bacterium]
MTLSGNENAKPARSSEVDLLPAPPLEAPTPETVAPAEHHLTTARTARYYTLGSSLANTKRVWFALHGYAQLAARFLRHFKDIVPADTLIVAPEALSRFYLELPRADRKHMERVGAAWMTREDREADMADTRAWLDSVYRVIMDDIARATGHVPEVTILAFSQSVAISMRWIAGGVVNPARVIMWAGSLANDVDADEFRAGLGDAEVILVAGELDHFLTEKARATILGQWHALGVNPREIIYEDGVHELEPSVLATLLQHGQS